MPQLSAGILLYRRRRAREVFLVHPGGPYWRNKDARAWSLPKGLIDAGEDPLAAARREFSEETGFALDQPDGEFRALGRFVLPGGKQLQVWAVEGDADPAQLKSNSFAMIWPPRSDRTQSFPEIDRGAWFAKAQALEKITGGQRPVLEVFFARR